MGLRASLACAAVAMFGVSFVVWNSARRSPRTSVSLPESTSAGERPPHLQPSLGVPKERSRISATRGDEPPASQDNPWDQCLSISPSVMTENALLECVARGLEAGTKPPGPEELGVWICASAMPKATLKQVAIEFLARILPSEALDYVDSTQRSCTKYESTAFFASCFASMKTSHPEWLVLVGKSLNPELLFDLERGVTIVQVAHALSGVQGGEWAEYLLAEGGLGNFGGTSDQIDRSLTATLTLKASPSERLGYIEKVLNSINTPGGAGIGQTVMHFLFASTGNVGQTATPVRQSCMRIDSLTMIDSVRMHRFSFCMNTAWTSRPGQACSMLKNGRRSSQEP